MTPYTLVIDGALVPVTNLFDDCGDEVETWEAADRFVAGPLPDGMWLSALVADYQVKPLH